MTRRFGHCLALATVLLWAACSLRGLAPGAPVDDGPAARPGRDGPRSGEPADSLRHPRPAPESREAADAERDAVRAEESLDRGDLIQARRWALEARAADPGGRAGLLLSRVYRRAVAACAGPELDFDDRLVLELAARALDAVRARSFVQAARAERDQLEDLLPTAEDRFYNKHGQPRKECYTWLLE